MANQPVASVFLSYRRDDTQYVAGRLYDRLAAQFGEDHVFMDVASIKPGSDFYAEIHKAVGSSDVVLALIGLSWVTAKDERGNRRLDDAADLVRMEITAALDRKVGLIPVLVEDTRMPHEDEIPIELRPLTRLNAAQVRHVTFRSDAATLIAVIISLATARRDRRALLDRSGQAHGQDVVEIDADGPGRADSGHRGAKVVLVRGQVWGDNTDLPYLFQRAARGSGVEAVYFNAGVVASVDDVVQRLFTFLGGDVADIPHRDTTFHNWSTAVSVGLLRLVQEHHKHVWIAVDDLGLDPDGTPLIDEQIRMFFEQFGLHLDRPAGGTIRLMLIGYPDRPVPTRWPRDLWREDRFDVTSDGKADVAGLIRRWVTDAGARPDERPAGRASGHPARTQPE